MLYTIDFKDEVIRIEKVSIDTFISVTIYYSQNCKEDLQILTEDFIVNDVEDFILPKKDGIFTIEVKQTTLNEELTESWTYPYYGVLLNSIIEETEYFLCGCGCDNCDECGEDDKTQLGLILKIFSYYSIMYKYYTRFYDSIFGCLKCDILDLNQCILLSEKVTGKGQNKKLFNKIISSLYLSFYYAEYYNSNDKSRIDNKFKIQKFFKCSLIKDKEIECITEQIEKNMGIFNITFDSYVNKPPSAVGDYSVTDTNRAVKTITAGMFTNLTTPAYADPEGDAAQAVRIDTLPTNGAILKLSGVSVTIGQIILITVIASGALTIEGPDQNAVANCVFTFSVRDSGSMTFTS